MKECKGCKYADWKRTETGRLHPSGDGRCKYPYKVPELPASMYWIPRAPVQSGGHISRHQQLDGHCVYFSRGE